MPPEVVPAYAGLLKRTPVQVRSAKRVDAILDATAAALEQGGLEALTMRSVAAGAGVPTGTIYQFFADRETLIQALAIRYVSASTAPLDHVLAAPGGWSVKIDLLVDHYADMLRSTPAMRILWLAGVMDAATRRLAIEADDQIAGRLGADLSAASARVDGADRTPTGASSSPWSAVCSRPRSRRIRRRSRRPRTHEAGGDPLRGRSPRGAEPPGHDLSEPGDQPPGVSRAAARRTERTLGPITRR